MRKLLLILGVLALADSAGAADLSSYSGSELYLRFCAACHGTQARGDGPVASTIKVEVPDLRLIARRHGGKYPRDQVERIIDGRQVIGAHGVRTMPVWGEAFALNAAGDPQADEVALAQIRKLVDYLETIQMK